MARKKTYVEKLSIKFNRATLDRILIVLTQHCDNKKFARSVLDLFSLIDASLYVDDIERFARFELGKKVAKAISTQDRLTSVVLELDLEGKYEEKMTEIFTHIQSIKLSESEVKQTDKLVSRQLKYGILKNNTRKIIDLMTELETETFDDYETVLKDTELQIGGIYRDLRNANASIVLNKFDLKLDDESLSESVNDYLNDKKNSEYRIQTGIQDLNNMLSGGWNKGRLYCVFAPKKSGKSLFMLNACIWARQFNTFDTSDGRRPVIVLLSMENTTSQQRDRLWKWVNGNNLDVSKVSPSDYMKNMRAANIIPTEALSPRIDFLYRANQSISTDDINTIIEEYDANNERVVFFALDYIGRIRAADKDAIGADEYTVLACVTNELVNIARDKNIPILTAAQMNRLAMEGLDKAGDDFLKKMDAASKATSSNVQGSFKVTQNVDYGFALNFLEKTEKVAEGDMVDGYIPKKEQFFFLKLTEVRDDSPMVTQFFHPMEPNNGCKYAIDINNKKKSFQKLDLSNKIITETYSNLPISGSMANGKVEIIRFEGM